MPGKNSKIFIKNIKISSPNKIKFTTLITIKKIIKLAKKQTTTAYEEKTQSIQTDLEMTQIIELIDKNTKTVITTLSCILKKLGEKLIR